MSELLPSSDFDEVTFNTLENVIKSAYGLDSTDCCFQFGDKTSDDIVEIKAHRKLLSALSPVFATMFSGTWNKSSKVISIEDVTADDFETFLCYFYNGKVRLNTDNVYVIFYLAHKYNIEEVMASCSAIITKELDVDNVIGYLKMSLRFNQHQMKAKCIEFITTNTGKVLASAEFIHCDKDTLMEILKIASMNCKEHIVFDGCIKWAKTMCHIKKIDDLCPKNLRTELGECFTMIRFKEMDRDAFTMRYEAFNVMFTKEETDDYLMHFIRMKNLSGNTRYLQAEMENKRKNEEIVFKFDYINIITKVTSKEIEFKLSHTLMLDGITISQPHVYGTSIFLNGHVSVDIQQMGTGNIVLTHKVKTVDEKYARIVFPKLVLIEKGEVYMIKINMPEINSLGYFFAWNKLHCFQRRKWHSFEIIPLMNNKEATDDIKSVISEMHFKQCEKEDFIRLFGDCFKFDEIVVKD